MAGGAGSRLDMGEKPLVKISGIPMLQFVTDAFTGAGHEILVVTSDLVPMTKNWCRAKGFETFNASGQGYIEDLLECIRDISISGPVFSCVSDLPGLSPDIVKTVLKTYIDQGRPALSVWVPEKYFTDAGCTPSYTEPVDGCSSCPVGLNIIDASMPDDEQEEYRLLLRSPELTFNVNCRKDFESFLNFQKKNE